MICLNLRLGSITKNNLPNNEIADKKIFLSHQDLLKIVNKSLELENSKDIICTSTHIKTKNL